MNGPLRPTGWVINMTVLDSMVAAFHTWSAWSLRNLIDFLSHLMNEMNVEYCTKCSLTCNY